MTGEIQIRVRYAETDRMGLLHHANYLVYFEQARTELLAATRADLQGPRRPGLSARADEGRGALQIAGALRRRADDPHDGRADDARSGSTTATKCSARAGWLAEAASTLACVDRDGRPQALPELRYRERLDETQRRQAGVRRATPVDSGVCLPLVFCLVPLWLRRRPGRPGDCRRDAERANFYLAQHLTLGLDCVILVGLGASALFSAADAARRWRALRAWRGDGFDERPDRWLTHLAQAAEWFPLLGLLGTVAGILQTFSSIGGRSTTPQQIITLYAPAITATGSGLFMALINILPTWLVLVGRDLIRSLGGERRPQRADRQGEVTSP